MNRILEIWKKSVLTLAIALMTIAGAWAQVTTITIGNGKTVSTNYTIPSGGTVEIVVESGTGTYSGVISGGGTSCTITKKGTGKAIITNANTVFGSAIGIDAGTLQLGNGTTNGSFEQVKAVAISAGAILRFEPAVGGMIFSQVIRGSGKVEYKGGSETLSNYKNLYLTGNNQYTGGTTIEATESLSYSRLYIGNNTTTGAIAGNVAIGNNGSLRFMRSNNYTYTGVISGTGSVIQDGSDTLTFTGTHTYTGATNINRGTLQLGDSTSTGSIANESEIRNYANLIFNRSNDYTYSGVISGTGTVTKKGPVKLYLTGNNTYTGTTTIEAGGLNIGHNTSTGDIKGDIVNNSFLSFYRSNAYTYDGVVSGTGGVSHGGTAASVLTLTKANTYTGRTDIYAPLILSADGSIANSSSVTLIVENSPKLDISAGDKKIKALKSANGIGEVVLGSRTLTIGTAGQNDGTGDFTGKFTGTGGVTKTGTGAFTMSGTNTATGTFTHSEGTVNFSGTWAGNYNKEAGATLTVTGNPTIGGTLTLAGGNINMNLKTLPPSKLSVTGAVVASGTNTLNMTTNAITNCVLIQAASGISATDYTVNLATLYSHLSANGTQLLFTASSDPIVPVITTTTLPSGVEGTPYNETLTATGLATITWSFIGGNLPPGLSLASNGVISGTPTATGAFNFTVKAENSAGNATQGLSITINNSAVAPTITTTTLPDGMIGLGYSENLAADGTSPITWVLESGSLPDGLSIASTGVISGTPTAAGTFNFKVKATNPAGSNAKDLSITVANAPVAPTITTTTLSDGKVGIAYNGNLVAGGSSPITWTLESGYLPDGLMLSSTGVISGTPTMAAEFTFTVQAQNSAGQDSKVLTIKIESDGVDELGMNNLRVYPNPTTGELRIENGEWRIENVEVFDIYGKKLLSNHLIPSSSNQQINISELPAGVYFLRIQTETGTVTQKVIKQ